MSSTPSAVVVVSKFTTSKGVEEKRFRGPVWVFIEILFVVLTVSGVNQKLCDGRRKRDHLSHMKTSSLSLGVPVSHTTQCIRDM
jgi:hypothetical protein